MLLSIRRLLTTGDEAARRLAAEHTPAAEVEAARMLVAEHSPAAVVEGTGVGGKGVLHEF